MAKAIVDVDGILWDFHTPLMQRLGLKELPQRWDFYKALGISGEDFYAAVRLVHEEQYIRGQPFAFASALLDVCRRRYAEVIVASHRDPGDGARLAIWMVSYGLSPFSGVYCGYDKSFLFQPGDLVIDDSPGTIRKAGLAGAIAMTIAYPWNEGSGAIRLWDGRDIVRLLDEPRVKA